MKKTLFFPNNRRLIITILTLKCSGNSHLQFPSDTYVVVFYYWIILRNFVNLWLVFQHPHNKIVELISFCTIIIVSRWKGRSVASNDHLRAYPQHSNTVVGSSAFHSLCCPMTLRRQRSMSASACRSCDRCAACHSVPWLRWAVWISILSTRMYWPS